MAKRLAILNYMFLFDPSDTGWTSASKFESWLQDYCAAYGYEADVIETAGSGVKAIALRSLTPLDVVKDMTNKQTSLKSPLREVNFNRPNPVGRPKQPGSILRDMSTTIDRAPQRDFKKGRLLKSKGYIKR